MPQECHVCGGAWVGILVIFRSCDLKVQNPIKAFPIVGKIHSNLFGRHFIPTWLHSMIELSTLSLPFGGDLYDFFEG